MDRTTDDSVKTNSTSFSNMTYSNPVLLSENRAAMIMWRVWPPCLLLLGSFGNITTIFVMRRIKGGNSSQHLILISLAVADFALLYIGALCKWIYYITEIDVVDLHTVLCKLLSWLIYSVGTISAWLLTCVTMQRTLAVLWPHKMRMVCTVQRTWAAIGIVVIAACCLHFHFVIGMEISEYGICGEGSASYRRFVGDVFAWVDMLMSSLLPAGCLIVCDVILSMTLFRAASSSSITVPAISSTSNNKSRKKTASKTTAMILTLSGMFLILTLPACLYLIWIRFALKYVVITLEFIIEAEFIYAVTMNLWYTNSAINFLLYCFTGTKFRREFLMLCRCRAQHHATTSSETAATSLSRTSKQYDTTSLSTTPQS